MDKRSDSWFARTMLVPVIAAAAALGVQAAQDTNKARTEPNGTQAAQQKKPSQVRQLLASDVVGMSVRGPKGNNIGQVDDLVIDLKTGQIRYAALKFDPGILSVERMVPIPVKELSMGGDGNSLLYQKNTKEQLERMAMNKSEWNDDLLRSKDRLAKIDNGWGLPPYPGTSLVRASTLMDKEVQNKAGENIGEIEDLVINMDQQKVHYAMLEFERSWLTPERTVAVPLSAFRDPISSGDDLVMDVTKERAKEMKGLTRDQIRNPHSPEVLAIVERHFIFLDPASAGAGGKAKSLDNKPDTRSSGAAGSASSGGSASTQK